MFCLKLLSGLLLLGLVLSAPANNDNDNLAIKKRVERNRRQLDGIDSMKLDLDNGPLKILENSLELRDDKGDDVINGTKVIDGANIEYFHQKNKGTIKTIVEEKKEDKMDNVFYHLSYEKTTKDEQTTQDDEEQKATTQDTTDQTLYDETSPDDDETTTMENDPSAYGFNNNNELPDLLHQNDDDETVPSSENQYNQEQRNGMNEGEIVTEYIPDDQSQQVQSGSNSAGWFGNWFNWLSNKNQDQNEPTTDANSSNDMFRRTPHLDNAIDQQQDQFTFISPLFFSSVGLRSPSCPPTRPTLVTVYLMSFCI